MSKVEGNRIVRKLQTLRANGAKALITYITAGDPDLATTAELVLALEKAGADLIELGVPFSDPLADGPIIQRAAQRALERGTTLTAIMDLVTKIREQSEIPLLLMTYYNPVLQLGLDNFVRRAKSAGVDGVIIPDLPVEEAGELLAVTKKHDFCLVPLVAPTSTPERIAKITRLGQGFVYCVSLTGVTGIRENIANNIDDFLQEVRLHTDLPMAVGFGISNPEQAARMAADSDGVIVGSALVSLIEQATDHRTLLESVTGLTARLKEAVASA